MNPGPRPYSSYAPATALHTAINPTLFRSELPFSVQPVESNENEYLPFKLLALLLANGLPAAHLTCLSIAVIAAQPLLMHTIGT